MGSPPLRPLTLRGLSLLTGALAVTILLLLVELVFRLLAPPSDALPLWLPVEEARRGERERILADYVERHALHQPDRALFWRNRPGVDITLRGVRVRTNSLGLRDDEVPVRKSDDEFRILVLGESTAFGDEVEQEEIFLEVLEDELDRRSTACRISVINAAVTGYSLFQSLQYLGLSGLVLEPDLVMIYHGYNDFLPTTFATGRSGTREGESGKTDRERFEARSQFPANLDLILSDTSAAWRWLRGRLSPSPESQLEFQPGKRRRVPGPDREQILAAMRHRLDDEGVGMVILVPAYRSFAKHRDLLLKFAERTGTPAIDLLVTVPARPRDRVELFRDDGVHPTPALHTRFAAVIGRSLLDRAPELGLARCFAP
jgi:lysophospholipase L1-like esterase